VKTYEVDGIGLVSVYKRRGAKSLSLRLDDKNRVKVTIPSWTPFIAGAEFAKSRQKWISEHQRTETVLANGQAIGKAHHLRFVSTTGKKVTSRIRGTEVFVGLPQDHQPHHETAQHTARQAAIRALKKEAVSLLPQRLETLAGQHSFSYSSVSIKKMTGRWGSCSHKKDIVLNCFLMQLPWDLIDYVIIHELSHTKHMSHGQDFWAEVAKYIPNPKSTRKAMKSYQPTI
jgi:predicted metal-dependent hydrolase